MKPRIRIIRAINGWWIYHVTFPLWDGLVFQFPVQSHRIGDVIDRAISEAILAENAAWESA